ncbi:MAG: hypothetical protein U9Q68_01095 [Euryarchaeota archaeon]|nr:hypothetical protein [Euryarchaeota archaeon]
MSETRKVGTHRERRACDYRGEDQTDHGRTYREEGKPLVRELLTERKKPMQELGYTISNKV